jgi:hypothetical protein
MYRTPKYKSGALPLDQPVQFFQYFTMLHNTIFRAWARILLSSAASRLDQGPPILSSSGEVKNAWNFISASPYIYMDGV